MFDYYDTPEAWAERAARKRLRLENGRAAQAGAEDDEPAGDR